jgi:hypothetical protein
LLQQAVPHRHQGGYNTINARVSLGQLLRPLPDLPMTTFANHQADTKDLQDAKMLLDELA